MTLQLAADTRAARLADLPEAERAAYLSSLGEAELAALLYDWQGSWARPDQREPTDEDWQASCAERGVAPEGDHWLHWLLRSGRGAGKTRTGAEWVRAKVEAGIYGRLALVAPTAADTRDVVVEGESGVLATARHDWRPTYVPSKRRLEWPNGARAFLYSAEEPDRLRGPQHDAAWCDELAAWRHPEAWDMLLFGLRLGALPRAIITTTPRPTPLVKRIANDPATVVTVASTYANAGFLAPQFMQVVLRAYEGTHLGRQEIHGEIVDDLQGALWNRALLESTRLDHLQAKGIRERMAQVVVAVDPAVSTTEGSDETGIVVVGKDDADPPHGYTLEDLSGRYTPDEWATKVVQAMERWQGNAVVAEVNQGGDLVKANVRTVWPLVPFVKVHATRGKYVRAEPVSTLWEQGRAHMVGLWGQLEDQLCIMTPDLDRKVFGSPDRADAMVWGYTHLLVGKPGRRVARSRSG